MNDFNLFYLCLKTLNSTVRFLLKEMRACFPFKTFVVGYFAQAHVNLYMLKNTKKKKKLSVEMSRMEKMRIQIQH